MRFLGFGKRKSKARHTSPVQQLVLHTQNLGRAHSCSDLDRIEKRESWANGPPAQMVPYPSAGGRQSRQRQRSESTISQKSLHSKPPRPSHDSIPEVQNFEHANAHASPLSNQNALVENNEIFETLKAENAGLKEKIKVIESQHERELTREIEKAKKARKKRPKNADSMLSLDSQLDFPVDKAAAELQKIITDLRVENGRLNGALVKKEQLLDDFKADMEKMQDESSQLKRKNLFLAGDTKSRKIEIDDLKHEVFEARHAFNQLESSQMETVLELERNIRRLENDLQVANFNFDQLSRDRAAGISQIDHKKIVNSIHNQYQEKMKEKEVEVLEEKILTAKQEEKVNDLNSQIEELLREKEEIRAAAEEMRQRHCEENSSYAPLVVENEMLKNKNSLLQQKLNAAQREVQNLQIQGEVEKQVLNRSVPSDKSIKMKEMMLILQDDWRNVARLIKDVETEKSRSMNLTYAKELKTLNSIAMDIQHREMVVQQREADSSRLLSIASLRETARKF